MNNCIIKKDQFDNSGILINIDNNNIPIKDYKENIWYKYFWVGDLEISEWSELYKLKIIVYKKIKRDDISTELSFYNLYGNI